MSLIQVVCVHVLSETRFVNTLYTVTGEGQVTPGVQKSVRIPLSLAMRI